MIMPFKGSRSRTNVGKMFHMFTTTPAATNMCAISITEDDVNMLK